MSTTNSEVPFTDLAAMARDVWPSIKDEMTDAILTGRFIGGPAVETFERRWAEYCQTGYAVGTANGTDALQLTLEALGIGQGDEVIVPANTFIASVEAIVRAGATPRFADVDPTTLLLTAETFEAALSPRTTAVMVVHLYGQMPDMTAICAAARRAGVLVVEDAAQAHGAEWKGRRAGSYGIAGCFSFYPGKNIGAFGDAGAVVTSDADVAERIRCLANHGRSGGSAHYEHELLGMNSRLDSLQAIALLAKLSSNEAWTSARSALANEYRTGLSGSGVQFVERLPGARHVYHLYVVRVADRERVQKELADKGIRTGVHYPVPCHQQPPLIRYADRPLPVCERTAGEVLSLPLFPHMKWEQLERVCEAVHEVIGNQHSRESMASSVGRV